MRRLKLLQITGAHLEGSYSFLPRELIWLCWPECPLKSLPSDFHLSELILNKLKILNLSYSNCLVKTPNFRGLPSLERLILVECMSLVEVHQSIGNLKSLVLLNLMACKSLKTLPETTSSLKSLQTLNVTECSQLEKLPESLGDLESLTELFAKGTAIKQLPTSARYLKKLTKLSFGGYKNVFYSSDPPSKSHCSNSIAMLPASFTSFSSLKELDLSNPGLSDAISSIDLGSLSYLENLNLSGNGFFNLPSGISRLPRLQNSTKHSWIQRVPLIGLEESLQGVEELELNVNVSLYNVRKCWVEKCGVHLIMEKSKADSDIHGEKWNHEIDLHALGSSTTDDQRLESSLIRELQKGKITSCIKFG
ncbi:TMV resistance protein [Salix suchowensis]|nr:TMV resistance protein [Salix suchowensis]